MKTPRTRTFGSIKGRHAVQAFGAAAGVLFAGNVFASDLPDPVLVTKAPRTAQAVAYDWTGFYVGGHLGIVWGNASFASTNAAGAPTGSGAFSVEQPFSPAFGTGSFYGGLQAGYNRVFSNRLLLGIEVDASANSWVSPKGFSIGGGASVLNGAAYYAENGWNSGTVRGRIGYAPGNWLFYATGGWAWALNNLSLTENASGVTEASNVTRHGWAAGAGVEAPLLPQWTARLEYLYASYGKATVDFPQAGERFTSTLSTSALRLGVNYQIGDRASTSSQGLINPDDLAFHAQATATWQGYPAFSAAYSGPKSLPSAGQSAEIADIDIFAGYRLWRGAELWFNPEVNQGSGLNGTAGVVNFTNNEAYKIGLYEPYTRLQRLFIRQTIDLGGAAENVGPDLMQFAGTHTADRIVLTVGRFTPVDIFDTNRYANSPKTQFFNWGNTFNTTYDFASDAWTYTYGAAAEYYFNRFTIRGGIFDLSQTPEGAFSPLGYGDDPNFRNINGVLEFEERHELWGQPGKIKLLANIDHGPMGSYTDALAWGVANNTTPALDQVRQIRNKWDFGLNIEQQIAPDLGFFLRAGWLDPRYEPYEGVDQYRYLSAGISIQGERWGRPQDTVGFAGVFSQTSQNAINYFNAGGNGSLVWDGALLMAGPEKIFETYYNLQVTASANMTFDYQFVVNPSYNAQRGPVNVFGGRVHWQY